MNREEKGDLIEQKCREAGCSDVAAKRHYQAFVYERWDVHPPAEFREWYKANGPGTPENPANAITGWNVDSVRQEFYKSRGETVQEEIF